MIPARLRICSRRSSATPVGGCPSASVPCWSPRTRLRRWSPGWRCSWSHPSPSALNFRSAEDDVAWTLRAAANFRKPEVQLPSGSARCCATTYPELANDCEHATRSSETSRRAVPRTVCAPRSVLLLRVDEGELHRFRFAEKARNLFRNLELLSEALVLTAQLLELHSFGRLGWLVVLGSLGRAQPGSKRPRRHPELGRQLLLRHFALPELADRQFAQLRRDVSSFPSSDPLVLARS